MKLEMKGQLRMEQKMKLAPRMIQAMEILQLPSMALLERIEQELNDNPVLEIAPPAQDADEDTDQQPDSEPAGEEQAGENPEDFERLNRMDDDYKEYLSQAYSKPSRNSEEVDKKLEAIKNTAAPSQSLHEHLADQWRLVEAEPGVKAAGSRIIDYIDDRGYLSVRIEQLHNKDRKDFSMEDLHKALAMVQQLEPTGVGARDIRECLLIQIDQGDRFSPLERAIVADHMDELMENRLPDIARKLGCSMERLNEAISRLSKLDTSPGLQINQDHNYPITADVIVEYDEDCDDYTVRTDGAELPPLKINNYYQKLATSGQVEKKAKNFLQENIRSAQWIMDAIAQRRNTLLRVTQAIVKHQRDFFDKGPLHLKPLPMSKVADEVGVHLATVSRAVAGKYVQCDRGIFPLRKFFSGGTENANGESHSWEAVRAKLQQIINAEDKTKPLSDDQIRKKLAEQGINDIARRTVAKYRNILNIPSARLRKQYGGK